ncbi:MAG: hypothetical protein E6J89_14870 [Deltaproteobacteria bacterium]|nr:MAG: hypothetical protein E6J89_14870 [Deltaproteobacteria bacterium]
MAEQNIYRRIDSDPERLDTYRNWQAAQKIPIVRGFFVEDVRAVEVGPWELKGGLGAFIQRCLRL